MTREEGIEVTIFSISNGVKTTASTHSIPTPRFCFRYDGMFRKQDLVCLPILLLVIWLWFRYDWVKVTSTSMDPTIKVGWTTLLTNKIISLDRGDVVYVNSSMEQGPFIHRIAGLPGEIVTFEDGKKYHLQEEQYFIKGDNVNKSDEGVYSRTDIKQKVLWVLPYNIPSLTHDEKYSDLQVSIDHHQPRWSADGSRLIYVRSDENSNKSIQMIGMAEAKPIVRKLCDLEGETNYLSWIGNNSVVYYNGLKESWFIIGLEKGSEPRVTSSPIYSKPNIRRVTVDGERIILIKHPQKEVWVCSRQVPVGALTHLRLFLFDGTSWYQITHEGEKE